MTSRSFLRVYIEVPDTLSTPKLSTVRSQSESPNNKSRPATYSPNNALLTHSSNSARHGSVPVGSDPLTTIGENPSLVPIAKTHSTPAVTVTAYSAVPPSPQSTSANSWSPSPSISSMGPLSNASQQYTIVPITTESTAGEVCRLVARKRNVSFDENEYELIICDSDGMDTFEKSLSLTALPYQFQADAAKHGHLGNFRFVFRKIVEEEDLENSDDSDGGDIFGPNAISIQRQRPDSNSGKHPGQWMEKRGNRHRAFRRRYFVLMDDRLYYYKNKTTYDTGKEPIAFIELADPPAVIRINSQLMNEPTHFRKRTGGTKRGPEWWYFDIDTPKRIYCLRIENYDQMIYWVNILQRRNTPNEIIDGLQQLIGESEAMHAEEDEKRMTDFAKLDDILDHPIASNAYEKYLRSKHVEEFLYFWMDSKQFIKTFNAATGDTRIRFAKELYETYLKSGAKQEISEVDYKQRKRIRLKVENGEISVDMYDPIRTTVHNYLNRDAFKFFNSTEYFRFIITWVDLQSDDKWQWPPDFERQILQEHLELQSPIPMPLPTNLGGVHSPVFQSMDNRTAFSSAVSAASHSSPSSSASSPPIVSHSSSKRSSKRSSGLMGSSIFSNAPGISKSGR